MVDFAETMRSIPIKLWLLGIASAVLQTLPFPLAGPITLWRTAFCWVALTPLLKALVATDKVLAPGQAALVAYLSGCLWYLGNCYWIYQTMHLYGGLDKAVAAGILVLFCLYLGIYHALFGAIVSAIRRTRLGMRGSLFLSPFAWVAVELARARITGFPWDLLGVTQVDNPVLMHLVPWAGVYGASFVIALVNALWLVRLRLPERRWTRPALSLSAVVLLLLYALLAWRFAWPQHVPTIQRATLVQENLSVGAEASGNYETTAQLIQSFSALSLHPPAGRCMGIPELADTQCIRFVATPGDSLRPPVPADLIVWPESPSGFIAEEPYFQRGMADLARTAGAPLVVGTIGIAPGSNSAADYRKFDSAALIAADGSFQGRYDKIHLVPWGEYIPFKNFFFFANKLTAGVGDMDRGTARTVFRTEGHGFGVFICYESIFSDEVRRFVQNGAEVLVNISDDGWYGDTSAAWQHLNMARMRAIENHRWILRSTNTGVTAAIDPYGRVTVSAPRHIRTALRTGFNFERDTTFYTTHGDLFAYTCALITAGALGLRLLFRT